MDTYFYFENDFKSTEALITALKYDDKSGLYEITILGLDSDGYNYTNNGKLYIDDESIDELMKSDELELPHEVIGKK